MPSAIAAPAPSEMLVNRAALLAAAVAFATPSPTATRAADPLPSLAEPSLTPDGSEIAFVSGGDIWTVPATGGTARLLIAHEAAESRPLFSPDAAHLAFTSTRTGNGDIYVLTLGTGALRRVTFDDGADLLDAWSPDGAWLYFTSSGRDVNGSPDVLRVRASGGTPTEVAADRYTAEYWAAPSPDGSSLAITARGIVLGQWWRNGHSHIDESEIWVVENVAPGSSGAPTYRGLTGRGAKSAWPMWSADGRTLYYMATSNGQENLWGRPAAGGDARPLTRFTDGRVLWPSIARDGRTIVFERGFALWTVGVNGGEPRRVPVTLRGSSGGAAIEYRSVTNGFENLAVAPDGRKLAVVNRGELFAAATRDAGDATPLAVGPALEAQPAWAPDSRRVVYVSDREGSYDLYLLDVSTQGVRRLTSDAADEVIPRWSPDGGRIAYVRGGRELRVIGADGRGDRTVARGILPRPPFMNARAMAWSPDGRWLAYSTAAGNKSFTNVFIVPSDGSAEARQVSWLPNAFGGQLDWSPDGRYLLVNTLQRTEPSQLARIDLVPRTPRFREDQFRGLFEPEPQRPPGTPPADSAARPAAAVRDTTLSDSAGPARRAATRTEIVFEGIRERLTFVPLGYAPGSFTISPDGKQLAFTASVGEQSNIFVYPMDELARERVARQITTTTGGKTDVQWSRDSRELYYVENGRVNAVTVESRAVRAVGVAARLDVDFEAEKPYLLDQAHRYLRDNFYDEEMHGANWTAVRDAAEPYVLGARTREEMRRALSLMVGELNASHLGVGGQGSGGPPAPVGRLGVRFDRATYERDGRMRITEILPLSPLAIAGGVRVGDVLASIDGVPVGRATNVDSMLTNRVERRTVLGIAPAGGGVAREVVVQPVNGGTERGLRYRAWVESRRAYVDSVSGGRLGYVHMPDMGQGSLTQLYLDLDAQMHAREGVVIDVRHNNGGFVNAYALDVFARRPYLTMQPRGGTESPARAQLGQRALELPTVLVTDQHSLSDAEDFTEGYRALGLGKVVGEPTAGWIIFTSNATLGDGTSLRIPFSRIRGADGANMELKPRPVDVEVTRPVGESYTGRDSQLDAAVRVLLAEPPR